MSYDLMVFSPDAAPRTRADFMSWYDEQTLWTEEHCYDDPAVTSDNLKEWFLDMISIYPAMNGPYANEEDEDSDFFTDYTIGKNVIYAAFAWTLAEQAYEQTRALAQKHRVGFFDASANDGDILFPDADGQNHPIDTPHNLSSIDQIKNSATPEQESLSVKDIVFSRLNLQSITEAIDENPTKPHGQRTWWQRLFKLK